MSKSRKLQRGQAMSEYMVLLPAAIMIAISASTLAGFIMHSLRQTVDGLNGTGVCMVDEANTPDSVEGPTTATPGNHSVSLTNHVYDPNTNITTVTYTVQSGTSPTISHWMLGVPEELWDNLVEIQGENAYEYVTDPTTGVRGIKFDTGYEGGEDNGGGGEDNGGGNDNGNGNGNGNNGNGNGNPNASISDGYMLTSTFSLTTTQEEYDALARDVTLLFTNNYTFTESQISIKAGTDVYVSTLSMPTAIIDETNTEELECD